MDKIDQLQVYLTNARDQLCLNPHISLMEARNGVQVCVEIIGELFQLPAQKGESLFEHISRMSSSGLLPSRISGNLHQVRKTGNRAAHAGSVTENDAEIALERLENIAGWTLLQATLRRSPPPRLSRSQHNLEPDLGQGSQISRAVIRDGDGGEAKRSQTAGNAAPLNLLPLIPVPIGYDRKRSIWIPFIDCDYRRKYLHIQHDWRDVVRAHRANGSDIVVPFDDVLQDGASPGARFLCPETQREELELLVTTRWGDRKINLPKRPKEAAYLPVHFRSFSLRDAFPILPQKGPFISTISFFCLSVSEIIQSPNWAVIGDEI